MHTRIKINRPIFEESKIKFTWESSKLDSLFRNGLNFIEIEYYEDLKFDLRTSYNQAICLLFPIIEKSITGTKEVIFEDTQIGEDIQNWIDLREFQTISISSEVVFGSIELEKASKESKSGNRIALLYGGGKDSLGALSVFSNLYPDEAINLLRVHWSKQSVRRHREIFHKEVFIPIEKKVNVNLVECSSTLHFNLLKRETAHSIGIHFYHGCFLPLYEKYQFKIINYSYDAMEFYTKPGLGYVSIRPEKARQTSSLLASLSIKSELRNISFGIPSFLHFDIIKSDNRRLLNLTYMCEDTKNKWCYNCRKCFTFGILGLEHGLNAEEIGFSYSDLFAEKGYIHNKVIPLLERQLEPSSGEIVKMPGSKFYDPILSYKLQFSSLKHSLSQIDVEMLSNNEVLSQENIELLELICNLYAEKCPESRMIWEEAVKFEATEDWDMYMRYYKKINLNLDSRKSFSINNDRNYSYNFSEK